MKGSSFKSNTFAQFHLYIYIYIHEIPDTIIVVKIIGTKVC